MRENSVHNSAHDKCKFGCLFDKRLDTLYPLRSHFETENKSLDLHIYRRKYKNSFAAVRQINDNLKLIIYKIEFGSDFVVASIGHRISILNRLKCFMDIRQCWSTNCQLAKRCGNVSTLIKIYNERYWYKSHNWSFKIDSIDRSGWASAPLWPKTKWNFRRFVSSAWTGSLCKLNYFVWHHLHF